MLNLPRWPKLGAALLLFAPGLLWSAPVDDVFTYRQPSGAPLQVRVRGDEFFAEETTLDGQRIIQDPVSKFWCYARLTADGEDLESTGIVASETSVLAFTTEAAPPQLQIQTPERLRRRIDLENRARLGRDLRGRFLQNGDGQPSASMMETLATVPSSSVQAVGHPTTGVKKGLTLLIRFPDRAVDVSITRGQVDNYCNQTATHYTEFGNNGSVSEFYADVSGGRLTYTNHVAEYYVTRQNRSYYTDETVARASELIKEALNALEAAHFDFHSVDADGDGVMDAVNCFYAGPIVNAWSKGL
jgi:hypothetical protein